LQKLRFDQIFLVSIQLVFVDMETARSSGTISQGLPFILSFWQLRLLAPEPATSQA